MSDATPPSPAPVVKKFLSLFAAKNLRTRYVDPSDPWDFFPGPDSLKRVQSMPKIDRREWTLQEETVWNCYSGFHGLAPGVRISKENPPVGMRALVIDYDSDSSMEEVLKHISASLEPKYRPNFIERSLSNKVRLLWIFEREIPLPSILDYVTEIVKALVKVLRLENLLAGYDPSSTKCTELWTNGGVWYECNPNPLPSEFIFGVVADVAARTTHFTKAEIPLEIIADEVRKRYPERWQGDFKVGAVGVRFWVPTADCPTGAQVKPGGMLCFTGNQGFASWEEIFGSTWCGEQRALHLGNAAQGLYFDSKNYWECNAGVWRSLGRTDALLAIKSRGVSDKTPKGATLSDAERVLRHVQSDGRIEAAGPLINYAPGAVELGGRKFLNTVNLHPVVPATTEITLDLEVDCPFINKFLRKLFGNESAFQHFLAWLRRAYYNVRHHKALFGQTLFFCGPVNNGKTLLTIRIIAPLLGGKYSDPTDYFFGRTSFSEDLFSGALLLINDSAPARDEKERIKFGSMIKQFVVNPSHTYHPKFCPRTTVHWVGRICCTLNDDPTSVSILPDLNDSSADKVMIFGTHPFDGDWPTDVEILIEKELPKFAAYLEAYQPPPEVLSNDRMGVKAWHDKRILELSQSQLYSYNMIELVREWVKISCSGLGDPNWVPIWEGTPTQLFLELSNTVALGHLIRDWSVPKLAKSLTIAARTTGSGIEFSNKNTRSFKIDKKSLITELLEEAA